MISTISFALFLDGLLRRGPRGTPLVLYLEASRARSLAFEQLCDELYLLRWPVSSRHESALRAAADALELPPPNWSRSRREHPA